MKGMGHPSAATRMMSSSQVQFTRHPAFRAIQGAPKLRLLTTKAATATYEVKVKEVPRGETAGAAMVVDEVTIQAGDRDLLQEVSWRVMPGQRWGLVGSNGCGKSTLLRALCGIRDVDAGRLIVAPKVEVGYLAQTAVSGSKKTVWEEARSQMTRLLKAEQAIVDASAELEAGKPGAAERLAQAQEDFIMAEGYDADKRITNVLTGLGFRAEQMHMPASEFSGGWQMRIALARLLLGEAGQAAASGLQGGLMLLDEPTNHLDSAAIKWLGNFLRTSGGTLILVSHDEALIEDVCDHIAEVRGQKLHLYSGGFNAFMTQRAEREAQAIATASAQQQEIDRLEAFVKRFGAKASKASSAQSKAKLADKLRAEMVEVPVAASSEGGGDAKKVNLKLPRAPPCFTDVLVLRNATIGWGNPSTEGNKPMLTDVNITIKKGQRLLVLGPNGVGKSTLLNTLSGALPLWAGEYKQGEGVKLGVFNQDLAQALPYDKTPLEYVETTARAHDPTITMEKCRAALGALGMVNSMVNNPIGVLSGGEKARVALAAFALVPSNVLLLDEASNHLDAATIKVLTSALQEFQGAIVAITHNPAFANSLNATHVLRLGDGKAVMSTNMGLTDADFDHSRPATPPAKAAATASSTPEPVRGGKPRRGSKKSSQSPSPSPTPPPSPAPSAAAAKGAAGKKRTSLSWAEQQEYQKLSKTMEELTKQKDVLEAKLQAAGNYKQVAEVTSQLGKVADQLSTVESKWWKLAEIAGDL